MKKLVVLSRQFLADEKAAEVTELGIVLALVVAVCVAAIAAIGGYLSAAYTAVEAELGP